MQNRHEHAVLTTSHFTDDVARFAGQYETEVRFKDRLGLFLEFVGAYVPEGARVLDFGCGPGVISLAIAGRGYLVHGIDGSSGMIATARKSKEAAGIEDASFELQEAGQMNLPSEHFDAVVCSSVIEYIPGDLAVVAELIKSLKPGGHLIISVPNAWSVPGVAERLLRRARRYIPSTTGEHLALSIRHYGRRQFFHELTRLGLQPIQTKTFEFSMFGALGVRLSRMPWFAGMRLVVAKKAE